MIANDLLKGTLRTIVLKLLTEHPRLYGYEITQKVEELSKGKIKLTFGALYPVLHKLEAEGYVRTETVNIGKRTRIYYILTESGVSWYQSKFDEFTEFVQTMSYILNPYPSVS
jgi:PadR family transcriptional regulator, regulatory protein PadR